MNRAHLTAPLTEHAERRSIDRNIPEVARWLLLEFGRRSPAKSGCVSYAFDKKAWKEVERFFGRWRMKEMTQLKNAYLVQSAEGAIVTVAYRS
ncbi:hypothetical protein [Maricaulis salignorans]|uniref:Uncharacterized protein n=1 Tax=Maricaulis salignorans TaxID=144026 RepID=A0A1G9UAR7_9PROT|nr:hypothetical protein [Maricaulis salignorans]SDM57076.1 hypothetical protein SAMN04488568_11464 [Maricaulis salignorans]